MLSDLLASGGEKIVTRAAEYRENARKIRRLVNSVHGVARVDALALADQYDAIAVELEVDTPLTNTSSAEQIALLIDKHGAELLAIRKCERDYQAKHAEARHARLLLEAKVAGILEVGAQLAGPMPDLNRVGGR